MPRLRLLVLASGRGSNLRAIARAIEEGRCDAEVVGLVTDRPKAPAIAFAEERGIPVAVVRPREHPDRAAWDAALAERMAGFAPEVVVLAGFMRIVGAAVLERFGGRIVNVHPSLLPAFPGMDGPAQAIAAGARLSGCTVHVVDAGVDTGPILAQAAVPVLPGDDAATLHARIQVAEHALLPAVLAWVADGSLALTAEGPRFVRWPATAEAPVYAPAIEPRPS